MSDIAIKVENISKKYQIGENKAYPTLRDKLMELPNRIFKGPKKSKEFWALRDVTFEVKKGEVVGIIGRNGAGKSTMLKILARITEPTSGKITMHGRVASMLEVGTGFNPELTGRENIYLNGAIIGMKKSEIKIKFDDIVEFSGVEKFLDTPVKHYSSGMYVRLAFAVSAHLDADILLVDEVLAVGDAEFQKKCLGKISDLSRSGRTVIFVSHNIEFVNQLCQKTLFLDGGYVKMYASTQKVITSYSQAGLSSSNSFIGPLAKRVLVEKIAINQSTKNSIIRPSNQDLVFEVSGKSKAYFRDLRITLSIYKETTRILTTQDVGEDIPMAEGRFKSTFIIDGLLLRPGVYSISVGGHQKSTEKWFYGQNISSFEVLPTWSTNFEQINIGLINVSSRGGREQ